MNQAPSTRPGTGDTSRRQNSGWGGGSSKGLIPARIPGSYSMPSRGMTATSGATSVDGPRSRAAMLSPAE
ncbi:hypothetical protein FR742_14795 [Nonomuraea sp. C10]|nr:hypothetical protein FR742_14795 [Nonomuraea sp. C10]